MNDRYSDTAIGSSVSTLAPSTQGERNTHAAPSRRRLPGFFGGAFGRPVRAPVTGMSVVVIYLSSAFASVM